MKTWQPSTVVKHSTFQQEVTELFLQHCISLTHNLWSVNSLIKAEFIKKYQDKGGRWHKCHVISHEEGHKWKG